MAKEATPIELTDEEVVAVLATVETGEPLPCGGHAWPGPHNKTTPIVVLRREGEKDRQLSLRPILWCAERGEAPGRAVYSLHDPPCCEHLTLERRLAGKNTTALVRDECGYLLAREPAHPLARRGGEVLDHRRRLHDAIGPGEHPCHWCSATLRWDVAATVDHYLTVDHVDGQKDNNDHENLVPACRYCNTQRAAGRPPTGRPPRTAGDAPGGYSSWISDEQAAALYGLSLEIAAAMPEGVSVGAMARRCDVPDKTLRPLLAFASTVGDRASLGQAKRVRRETLRKLAAGFGLDAASLAEAWSEAIAHPNTDSAEGETPEPFPAEPAVGAQQERAESQAVEPQQEPHGDQEPPVPSGSVTEPPTSSDEAVERREADVVPLPMGRGTLSGILRGADEAQPWQLAGRSRPTTPRRSVAILAAVALAGLLWPAGCQALDRFDRGPVDTPVTATTEPTPTPTPTEATPSTEAATTTQWTQATMPPPCTPAHCPSLED